MYSQVQVPIPIHGNTKSQFNLLVDYLKVSSIGTWKFMLIVDIMHKQQNWYLYNIHDRFRYHQKMLVLARYRYRYQNWCSPKIRSYVYDTNLFLLATGVLKFYVCKYLILLNSW